MGLILTPQSFDAINIEFVGPGKFPITLELALEFNEESDWDRFLYWGDKAGLTWEVDTIGTGMWEPVLKDEMGTGSGTLEPPVDMDIAIGILEPVVTGFKGIWTCMLELEVIGAIGIGRSTLVLEVIGVMGSGTETLEPVGKEHDIGVGCDTGQ